MSHLLVDVPAQGDYLPATAVWLDSPIDAAAVTWNVPAPSTERRKLEELVRTGGDKKEAERWLGAPSFEALTERIERGWPEGADLVRSLPVPDVTLPSVRRRLRRREVGDALRPEAVLGLCAMDRAWIHAERASCSAPSILTIAVHLSARASENADSLRWRGAVALRAADACEVAGIPCRIVGA